MESNTQASCWGETGALERMFGNPQANKRQKSEKPVVVEVPKEALKHFEEEKKGAEFVKPKTIAKDAFIQEGDKEVGSFFRERQDLVDKDTRKRWEEEQKRLRAQIVLEDQFDWQIENSGKPKYLKYVAGLDISYSKIDFQRAVAALVICEYPSMRMVYEDYVLNTADVPYIPGFLAFKEVPSYVELFDRLKSKKPELWPQVLLVDGNGIFHNRSFGCACHIGVITGIPSIGLGKNVFAVDGLTKESVAQLSQKYLGRPGSHIDLIGKSGKTWGIALKSHPKEDPLIVSQGHKISLKTALRLVQDCLYKQRMPEPIRLADERSRKIVKEEYDQGYKF